MAGKLISEVTFGVSSKGNIRALVMSLQSILMGTRLPSRFLIRLEGEFPGVNDFYFEQILDLARIFGVKVSLEVSRSEGVRAARDFLLKECQTPHLWMGDDDVIYEWDCLATLVHGWTLCDGPVYLNGSKPDVNNRRGYKDFSTKVHYPPVRGARDFSHNFFYEDGPGLPVATFTLDTGNVLFDVEWLKAKACYFSIFEGSLNSGGEDTLMSIQIRELGGKGYFHAKARAVHLEKPEARFDEFSARGEMIQRACDAKEWKSLDWKKQFMPWLWKL